MCKPTILCELCERYLPEYDYGYNEEGEYCNLIGFSCQFDLPLVTCDPNSCGDFVTNDVSDSCPCCPCFECMSSDDYDEVKDLY